MNNNLINVVNSKGYVVLEQRPYKLNKFGETDLVIIENSTERITFITNVFDDTNYFKIIKLETNGKTYQSTRYFLKYVSLISNINGRVFIKENNL